MIIAMTGLLIFGGTILLLVLALEPAQRHLGFWGSRPGEDSSRDRDGQRVSQEIRALAAFRDGASDSSERRPARFEHVRHGGHRSTMA